ncbi:hypothetical protein CBR_g11197 [Chara braunii]|uniref:Reverse transcriptase domain-containing protein n=1 Tax=Chara braunii TaxID=69332 RepID=A0A388KQG2_CHABU|nr:hypothetical protein CBR_g11197 [Chara braunii]|eukprot:GBG72267.1 hypothetical protein CBR_g11197 [Chara braunii]
MGISNAPATFQWAMNVTFQNFVNKTRLTQGMMNFCVIVYMDDILVYSETYHGHAHHIKWTLGALRDAGFKIALEKSEFFLSKISFLGYVVTRGGLWTSRHEPVVWPACLGELAGSNNNPPSQQQYLDPRGIIDLAFFQPRTVSEDEAITLEEEEKEEEEGGEEEKEEEEEEETPEEGSCSEHGEGEQSEEEEDEEEEDQLEEEEESEWEMLGEEEDRAKPHEKDPEAARRREEIAAGKLPLEFPSGVDLLIPNDPAKDPESPKGNDGDLAAETSSAPARRRRSPSPSPSTSARPPVRARTDAGHRASSPVLIPSSR